MKRNTVLIIIIVIFSSLLLNIPFTSAQSPISILSSSYYEQFGYSFVVGEIKNIGSNNLENIIITVHFYDENATKIASGFAYSKIQVLLPEQTSPFEVSSIPNNGLNVDYYEIEISNYMVSSFVPYRKFILQDVTSEIEDDEFTIHGNVYNNGSTETSWVRVIATYYDSEGNVIGTDTSYSSPDVISPGGLAPFAVDTFPRTYVPDSYYLQVECRESALTPSSLTLSLSGSSLTYGNSITASGAISPKVVGAEIILQYSKPDGSNFVRIATTDSSGEYTYTLKPDKAGMWSVIARWEGNENYTGALSTTKFFTVLKAPIQIPISVAPNEIYQNESVSIFGFIIPLISNGEISLNITRPDGSSYNITTLTNSGGIFNYSINPIEPGFWFVSAHYPGDQRYNSATSESILFHVIKVEHFGNITFELKDRLGNPLNGVFIVSITQPEGQTPLNGTTGLDGTIIFNEVYTGGYIFEISKIDYETRYEAVTVYEGNTTKIIISLGSRYGNLSLIVQDQEQIPVSGVFVESISQPLGQEILEGTTDENGSITFNDIVAGDYTFKLSKTGYETAYELATVIENETSSLFISLENLIGNIILIVRDQSGSPINGVYVDVVSQPEGQSPLNGITGANGTIVFNNVIIGNYTISFTMIGYRTEYKNTKIVEDEKTSIIVVLESLYGDVNLVVKDQNGVPVSGVFVESISQPLGQEILEGTTDENGSITFNKVLPGEYTVKLVNNDYLDREETFTVNPKGIHYFSLNIEQIKQFGNIKVVVKDEENNLLSNIIVLSKEYPSQQKLLNGTTDSNGLVIFSNVKIGEYTLIISADGYETFTVNEEVLADLTTDVIVILERVHGNDLTLYLSIFGIILVVSVAYLKREVISSYLSKM